MADAPHTGAPSLPELEAMIRSAGGYVQPTDDLRPRTLEAASERGVCRRGRRVVICLATLLLLLPIVGVLATPASPSTVGAPTSASDLHKRAGVLAVHRGIGPGWGLFEAFASLRREQARRLGGETANE